MQPVVHGLSRDAERLADVRGCGPQLAGLQDARGLQLIEVTPETADGLERLQGEIRRLEMPDEPTGELQHPHLHTVPGFGDLTV
jgi:hypothetical protein